MQCPKQYRYSFVAPHLSSRHGEDAIPKDQTIAEEVLTCFFLLRSLFSSPHAPKDGQPDRNASYVSCIVFVTLQVTLSRASSPWELVAILHLTPPHHLGSKPVRNGPLRILNEPKLTQPSGDTSAKNPDRCSNNATKWVSWSGNLTDMNVVHTHCFDFVLLKFLSLIQRTNLLLLRARRQLRLPVPL